MLIERFFYLYKNRFSGAFCLSELRASPNRTKPTDNLWTGNKNPLNSYFDPHKPPYETKTTHGIFTKSSVSMLLVQPHARYHYCNQQFRIHRNSCLCHLILWQSVRLRGVPSYPRKIDLILLKLKQFCAFLFQSENFLFPL